MTLSVAHTVDDARPMRGLLPLWVGVGIYALFLLNGNRLLADPDTLWQITVGQWILEHGAVPVTDVYSFTMRGQPWISTQWLAQVAYAKAYAISGWSGPVVLAASAIAVTFAMLASFLSRRLSVNASLIFLTTAVALVAGHLLARPHVLALPVMVGWVGGLVAAMDRRTAPSFWLLPLMSLWANLHGGFVFGLALIAPLALDAVWNADAPMRKTLVLRWALFAAAALLASCLTPYGWDALFASRRILNLGAALDLIGEWRPANFAHPGPLEAAVMLAFVLALWRGVVLPPMRVALAAGFVFMALGHVRNAEVLALLGPMVIAAPLARQVGGTDANPPSAVSPPQPMLLAGLAIFVVAGTLAFTSVHRFEPDARQAPAAAVTALKKLNLARVLNDYDFGGYLISSGVAPFIDGRTELYGEKFFVDHNAASGLMEPENLFRLLEEYKIEATFMRTESAATKLLDHIDGWQKVYTDAIATIHVRRAGAAHSADPAIDPRLR
ncbi:MAG TPA: hypothetical protein VFH41_05140 [Bradyrhizobium sp.]|nr:hypothetical protein [Bradyrhizobium sp.]